MRNVRGKSRTCYVDAIGDVMKRDLRQNAKHGHTKRDSGLTTCLGGPPKTGT